MTAKRIIAGLLSGFVCLSVAAACTNNDSGKTTEQSSQTSQTGENSQADQNSQNDESKSDTPAQDRKLTLFIRDEGKSPELVATFLNNVSGKTEDVTMQKVKEEDKFTLFSCEADANAYNMFHLTAGDSRPTMDVAFNEFISGWCLADEELLPYVVGQEPSYSPKYETKVMQFNGYDKNIYIWTPQDYDPKAEEKYSTIYLMDGQTVLTTDIGHEAQSWNVAEHVESMMAATDYKAIIVAIDNNGSTREEELIPDLGKFADPNSTSEKHGKEFCEFVNDTVVPYIDQNYNVYADASHRSVGGSSLGGLECFYIGMEHPETFGTVGALSPSFWAYDDETWKNYLSGKDPSKGAAFIYIYAGGYYMDNGICAEPLYNAMLEAGYPKDKIVYSKYEAGIHQTVYWRNIFPEYLEAVFTQKVTALECGAPIKYVDTTNPMPEQSEVSVVERSGVDVNYLYFDNSETKWDKVFAYWWGGTPTNSITGELYGKEWPGTEMEQMEGTNIYRLVVPLGTTNIIFDSGITDDEVRNGVIAYQTMDLPFNSSINAGQIFKIDVSQEAVPGRGKAEKTKFKYPAGDWSDYTE